MSTSIFIAAFLGVFFGEVCKILFDRYFKSPTERTLESIEKNINAVVMK